MADPLTYAQLLEKEKDLRSILDSNDVEDNEKEELERIWNALKTREESKFDAIINMIKDCDRQITVREKEIAELKRNQDHWKRKRKNIINIIKRAYEEHLINSMPTGNKYQATIRRVKSKLVDGYEFWDKDEKKNFGLYKTTMIQKTSDGTTVDWIEEYLPDKKAVRESLEQNDGKAPKKARLVRKFSMIYNLRKRLKTGLW